MMFSSVIVRCELWTMIIMNLRRGRNVFCFLTFGGELRPPVSILICECFLSILGACDDVQENGHAWPMGSGQTPRDRPSDRSFSKYSNFIHGERIDTHTPKHAFVLVTARACWRVYFSVSFLALSFLATRPLSRGIKQFLSWSNE